MKKLFYCVTALATVFFAGSCQRENLEPVAGNGQVTFTVEAPAALQTRAIADGLNVNELIYEVWLTNDNEQAQKLYQATTRMKVEGTQNRATLTLDLVNDQKFTVLFWAQVANTGAYNTNDLKAVSYAKTEYSANDESLAAFYGVAYVDDCQHVNASGDYVSSEVTLRRPFAQLNVGTLTQEKPYKIEVINSSVTVTGVNTKFNVATGDASAEAQSPMTFAMAAAPYDPSTLTVNDKPYRYAGMNYLFESDNVEVEYNIETSLNGSTTLSTVTNTISEVPLKENYRTNIIGNLLTSKVDYQIVVDEAFYVPELVYGDSWTQTGDYSYAINAGAAATSLKEVLEHADAAAKDAATRSGSLVVTINLNGNVFWETGAGHGSTPLLPADSQIDEVVINGNGNTLTATGSGVGSIRLANGGLLIFNDVNVVDKSVSYNENAWEFTYLEFAGNLEFNGCTFNSGIQFQTEDKENVVNASCVDCNFISNEASVYAVWVCDGYTSFTNCSFEGTRGLKAHEEYSSEVVEVEIDGCTFGPLSKKPGVALGTLNAETKVSITNCAFVGCQAGEQGNYMYETDTDVDSIQFIEENNYIGSDNVEILNNRLADAEAGDEVKVPAGEYTFPSSKIKAGVTLVCDEGTVFTGNSKLNINGATVIGATFSNPSGTAVDQTINGTFKNCVFEGANALRYCYAGETVVFENCVFSGNTYGIHFDGGANDVIFKNCTFSGFNATAAAITMITFDGCTFKSNGKSNYNGINLWGSAKMINTKFEFDGSVDNEWVDAISADKTYEFTGCTINGGTILSSYYFFSRNESTDITIDGTLYEDFSTVKYLASAKDMTWFAEQVNVKKNAYNGKTVKVTADIDLEGIDWEPIGQTGVTTFNGVFDGQNYTISNLSVDSDDQTSEYYSSGLFGWVETHTEGRGHIKNLKINGANISGHHNCGALVGYITEKYAVVENCHVTGAVIDCSYATADCDGDKAGALIGNATNATIVKNCTAANSTITAGRDAGQLIGAGKEANVTGCSATDVTVTFGGEGTGANIRNAVIGRVL